MDLCAIIYNLNKKKTTPILNGLNCKYKGENNGRRRSWGTYPGSQHFTDKRACWSFAMGLRRLTRNSITHTNMYKPNNKLVSA
jgi:hypothetical protein